MGEDSINDTEGMMAQPAEDGRNSALPNLRGGFGDDEPGSSAPDWLGGDGEQPAEVRPVEEQAVETAGQQSTLLGLLKSLGVQFGDQAPPDDYTALVHLAQRAQEADRLREQLRRADVYRDLGQAVAPKADQLSQFFQAQQQPAARKPWEPPPLDPAWTSMVARHPETGLYVALPGAPQGIAEKVNAFAEWQSTFLQNPGAVITPMIEERAREIVRQELEQRAASQSLHSQVQGIAQRHADWFYAKGPDGNVAYGPDGRVQVTPAGQQYLSLVREAGDMGVTDPASRDRYATRILGSMLQAGGQQPARQQPQVPTGKPGQVLQERRPQNRNAIQVALGQAANNGQGSFREMMKAGMEAAGIDDKAMLAENFWSQQ